MIGIPYAQQRIDDDGRLFSICPICSEPIEETERKDEESFTGSGYAAHYDAEHAIKAGHRIRVLYPNARAGDGEVIEVVETTTLKPLIVLLDSGERAYFHLHQVERIS